MEYNCVDRGGSRCPCILMEYGQCYTCTMSRGGECSCTGGWKGSCPYTEFVQGGLRAVSGRSGFRADVLDVKVYSADLQVVRVRVPVGLAQDCRRAGSFMMAETLGWWIPMSVLRTGDADGSSWSWIEFAVQPAGPKSTALLEDVSEGEGAWNLKGPYFSGLINAERLDRSESLMVLARGSAISPFINISGDFAGSRILVDGEKLTDEFLAEYLQGYEYEYVDFASDLEKASEEADRWQQVMFLASPFYTEKFLEMRPDRRSDIITANHSNMCCGEGLCGACSYTDADGITVRRCKCTEG